MPSFNSILKIIIAVAIAYLYHFGLEKEIKTPFEGFKFSEISEIMIENKNDFIKLKKETNKWHCLTNSNRVPDQALITNFLWHLSDAKLIKTQQEFSFNNIVITLMTTTNNSIKISLGNRLALFKIVSRFYYECFIIAYI